MQFTTFPLKNYIFEIFYFISCDVLHWGMALLQLMDSRTQVNLYFISYNIEGISLAIVMSSENKISPTGSKCNKWIDHNETKPPQSPKRHETVITSMLHNFICLLSNFRACFPLQTLTPLVHFQSLAKPRETGRRMFEKAETQTKRDTRQTDSFHMMTNFLKFFLSCCRSVQCEIYQFQLGNSVEIQH